MKDLIDYREKRFSQNGEDGIIARIIEVVGPGNKLCCEFGAWDGIYLSNVRSLILDGWSALFIEGDPEKFRELEANYAGLPNVKPICAFVDTGDNSLDRLLARAGFADRRLDVLSIDIDGLDYELFATLDRLPALPRLVVVEVHPEHGPSRSEIVPSAIARNNVGQPLGAFVAKGRQLGYRLVCYFGCNAFFVAEDCGGHDALPTLSTETAWHQGMHLHTQAVEAAEYVYLRNLGMAGRTLYRFDNPLLSAEHLNIPADRASALQRLGTWRRLKRRLRDTFRLARG